MENNGKPKLCEECQGVRRGRGWIHKEGCSKKTPIFKKTERTCHRCGGLALGRGYRHTDSCDQRKTRVAKSET